MPLFEMSPNVQEPNRARKRSHDEYSGDEGGEDTIMTENTPSKSDIRPSGDSLLPPVSSNLLDSSPQGSPALTEAGSSTAAYNSPSPETPTKSGAAQPSTNTQTSIPLAKRKKLTPAEKAAREKEATEKKEQKEKELAQKKQERDEKAALKAAEKAKQDEEKAARQKERDDKRKKKEEEDKLKMEQREEKKKQKEEEDKRAQEELEKKARAQPKLMSFFGKPSTPKKAASTIASLKSSPLKADAAGSHQPPQKSEYEKLFRPFYMRENTRMAPDSCRMDQETKDAKSKILDECIAGQRKANVSFDPLSLFALPGIGRPRPRGRVHPPVRHIMAAVYKDMELSAANGAPSAGVAESTRRKLIGMPCKIIAFSRDVRPPYYGTVTSLPFAAGCDKMRKVARNSTARRLQLDYDYDSEAEWQEDEGEDLDGDDGDEELDDEDDMDGFLDDSEDLGLSRRTFGNTMEPETTGICFENEDRKCSSQAAYDNKMELILDIFHKTASIDPFSTSYWEPEPKPPTSKPAPSSKATEKMPPPPAPSNAFAALNGGSHPDPTLKLVKPELINDVKKAILQNKALSKVGIVDYIFQQFRDSVSRIEVKNTLELVAEKKGTGKLKEWDLKPGHEITL